MAKQIESTLGERMQGARHEFEATLALGILKGRHTLAEQKEYFAENVVDWAFVEQYIADHKHEYPDYKD